jgi:hypothetical protein
MFGGAQYERDVLSAEAERVGHGVGEARVPGGIRHDVQRNIAYYGTVTGASGNHITLAYNPDFSGVGNSNPQTLFVSIIAGTGVGQYQFVQSMNGLLVTLVSPFAVQPDSNSVLMLSQVQYNLIFPHNDFN